MGGCASLCDCIDPRHTSKATRGSDAIPNPFRKPRPPVQSPSPSQWLASPAPPRLKPREALAARFSVQLL